MELIYLFIDNYKVIKNKEISLSSQFNVKNENLSFFVSKSSIPDNFFSENIDIVSFFGTNGSGKSTTIESFLVYMKTAFLKALRSLPFLKNSERFFIFQRGLGMSKFSVKTLNQ